MWKILLIAVLALATHTLADPPPQLITFGKNGEVGVNFGGYHASAGLGGLLSGGGVGGLHAEAGTPHGQAARAGLGGSFGEGGQKGGLYAGATAGGGTQAAAGLVGKSGAGGTAGHAFSAAQAGGQKASAGLGGVTGSAGSAGYSFLAHKSVHSDGSVVKEVDSPPPAVVENTVLPEPSLEVIKLKKKVTGYDSSVNYQAHPAVTKTFDFKAAPAAHTEKHDDVKAESQTPVVYKEVRVHKTRLHKPHHHQFKTWGGAGGYVQAGAGAQAPSVIKEVQHEVQTPAIQKRVDVVAESSADAAIGVQPAEVGYTKTVKFAQRNPTFFADIFNIPIQTLSAVSKLIGNAASGTSVSVEKSAGYAHADATPDESTKSLASEASVNIKTPLATSIIDDVFAIPINTLGAVNKFLQNNVPAKRVQVEGIAKVEEAPQIRLKGARRRSARRPVIILEDPPVKAASDPTST